MRRSPLPLRVILVSLTQGITSSKCLACEGLRVSSDKAPPIVSPEGLNQSQNQET